MPSFINAVSCLQPHARGQTALLDSFRYFGTSAFPQKHVLVTLPGEKEADPADRDKTIRNLTKAFHGSKIELVSLPCGDDPDRWRYYAEHELYPILHSKQPSLHGYGKRHRAMWSDYREMNEEFASKIAEIYKPGDMICIHDYHLCLVPGLVRKVLPKATIGFFLNTPFPSTEFVRCVSSRNDILEGMLGASMVIFQTENYARLFKSACRRMLGYDTRLQGVMRHHAVVRVEALPIGINVAALEEQAFHSTGVHRQLAILKRQYHGKKIIVSLDRLEQSRCVPFKLLAFEHLLEKHPQWREKVVLVHCISPSSVDAERDDEAKELGIRLSSLAHRINQRFGSLTFTPVRYAPQHISGDEFIALLRIGDVGFFTSVRDSMSRNALAYAVCQRDNHGVLIVSKFSGTAETVKSVTSVNPWRYEGVADELDAALIMTDDDRRETHEKVYEHVAKHTVQDWSEKLIKNLSCLEAEEATAVYVPSLDHGAIKEQYTAAKKRLIALDYDGTLAPIVSDPSKALPSDRLIQTLARLSSNEHNKVWIISGRDQSFMTEHLGGVPGLGLVAEHGAFVRQPFETAWSDMTEKLDMSWRDTIVALLEDYTAAVPGALLETKQAALTWHYRLADRDYGAFMANRVFHTLEAKLEAHSVHVARGKLNVEVRPIAASKGAVILRLLASQSPDFVICVGDDTTDEDMFNAMHSAADGDKVESKKRGWFNVRVGPETEVTAARWVLSGVDDVLDVLEQLSRR